MTENDWADLARQLIEAARDGGPSVTDWISAVSTAATLLIAILAAVIALSQLKQAKKLELDKSQPYVVMTMQESISPQFIDLVIKNYGQTAAYDVRVKLTPAPTRCHGDAEVVHLPEVIPVMAPGQEWRTHWDSASDRYTSSLPDRHEGTITYFGEREVYKEQIVSKAILDWSIYKSRLRMVEYGIHDVASSIREMTVTHKKWTESAQGGLRVYARDPSATEEAKARASRYYREPKLIKETPSAIEE